MAIEQSQSIQVRECPMRSCGRSPTRYMRPRRSRTSTTATGAVSGAMRHLLLHIVYYHHNVMSANCLYLAPGTRGSHSNGTVKGRRGTAYIEYDIQLSGVPTWDA